jgi:hypothetical protein
MGRDVPRSREARVHSGGETEPGGFFAAVAGFAVRFRGLVVIGWLAVTLAARRCAAHARGQR